MRVAVLAVAAVTLLILAGQVLVSPSVADDLATCNNASQLGADAIDACTRELNAGRMNSHNLSITYNNRGIAYYPQGRLRPRHRRLQPGDPARSQRRLRLLQPGQCVSRQGRLRPRHRRLQQAIQLDPKDATPTTTGPRVQRQGRQRPRHRRLRPGDPARSQVRLAYNNRVSVPRQGRLRPRHRRLQPGDPARSQICFAYYNRGDAYCAKGDYDRAIADFNQAIKLDPKAAFAYTIGASRTTTRATTTTPSPTTTRRSSSIPRIETPISFGASEPLRGNLAKALADLNQATALDPKDAYVALWLDIIGQRNNVPSRLSQAISTIDMTAWPAPVIRMFLGQMPPAAVLAAADDPDANKKMGQVCEANFYSGELALRQNAKNEATRLFQLAKRLPKTIENGSPPMRN